jgi:hypothetical protein
VGNLVLHAPSINIPALVSAASFIIKGYWISQFLLTVSRIVDSSRSYKNWSRVLCSSYFKLARSLKILGLMGFTNPTLDFRRF